jgi:hypothetical protein
VVLGIVALTGVHPLTLSLVAYLIVGGAVAGCGSAFSARMFSFVRR